jgi:hypothetical protein
VTDLRETDQNELSLQFKRNQETGVDDCFPEGNALTSKEGSSPSNIARKGRKMATIVEERTIAVTPRPIWSALTQSNEIAGWWANEAPVEPVVGSLGEFRFRPPAGDLQFEVAELDQDKKVSWLSRDPCYLAA